jgi:hypothetical protein
VRKQKIHLAGDIQGVPAVLAEVNGVGRNHGAI